MTKDKPIKISNKIKYKCSQCQFIEAYTVKEARKQAIWKQIFSAFFFLGVLAFIVLAIIGPTTVAQSLYTPFYMSQSNMDSDVLREIGANATRICADYGYEVDSFCHAIALFNSMDDIRYMQVNHFNLISDGEDILKQGDCKEVSTLFTATIKSIGFPAMIDCSLKAKHCVSIIPHYVQSEYQGEFAVVDLVIPALYLMDDNQSVWDYREVGQVIHKGFDLRTALSRGYVRE